MSFRPAVELDQMAVWTLWQACAAQDQCLWDANYPTCDILAYDLEHGYLHVMEQNGQIVGSVTLMLSDDIEKQGYPFAEAARPVVITRLCVTPSLQQKGCGRALFDYARRAAKVSGFDALHLLCDVRNLPALRLYDRVGCREVCRGTLYGDFFSVREFLL